jgi:hypothetical protein
MLLWGLQSPGYAAWSGGMEDEYKGIWKEAVVSQLRHHPGICLEGLRKYTKGSFITDSVSKFAPSEYKLTLSEPASY